MRRMNKDPARPAQWAIWPHCISEARKCIFRVTCPLLLPPLKGIMRLALFEPDIPPNTGTILRMAACFGVAVDIIEPCGFPFSERSFKRAGMDYLEYANLTRHIDFAAFNQVRKSQGQRLILVETTGTIPYTDFAFQACDILMLGRETQGTPADVEAQVDAVIKIPMQPGVRSLNVALAGAIVLGEALRQTGGYPEFSQIITN